MASRVMMTATAIGKTPGESADRQIARLALALALALAFAHFAPTRARDERSW